jgi:Glycosyl hydrolases family 43
MIRSRSVGAALAVLVLVVGVSGVAVWRTGADRDRAARELTAARARRADAHAALDRAGAAQAQVQEDLRQRGAERDQLAATIATTDAALQATALGLFGTRIRAVVTDRKAGALDECLTGVATTVNLGRADAALAALRAAQPSCTDALTAGTTAAYPFDFPDPAVLRVGAVWYAYSTNAGVGDVQVLASTDRRRWTIVGNALPLTAPWATRGATWAPAVIARPGGFALFYTARDRETGLQCTSVASGAAPQGPFVDLSSRPLICQQELGGSIDASPFVDADGQAWLTWKSEAPPTIWSRPIDLAQLRLTGTATAILHATQSWERGNVEAPSFLRSGSGLVLAYSGNRWDTSEYAIGVATCATPAGPCEKRGDGPALGSGDGRVGPGGAEFLVTDDGPAIAYAAYRGPDVGYPASRLLHFASFDPASRTFVPG